MQKGKSLNWRDRRKPSPQTTSVLAPCALEASVQRHLILQLRMHLDPHWSPLGWYTQWGCVCWCKPGSQGGWWIELWWTNCPWLKTSPATAPPDAQLTWTLLWTPSSIPTQDTIEIAEANTTHFAWAEKGVLSQNFLPTEATAVRREINYQH